LFNNVGATDVLVNYTATKASTLTTGSITLQVMYAQRNANGTSTPIYAN
jgi:hypothetical protein